MEGLVGSLALTLKILKRYGADQNLGEIKKWEGRAQPRATPQFPKGPNVFDAEYIKSDSPERLRLDMYESADGNNSYMLVASSGETAYGDNMDIRRKFLLTQLEYEAKGFRYIGGGSRGSRHHLFVKTGR